MQVDVSKTFSSRSRRFQLSARFASEDGFTVLFGPSGSGKTLTLNMLAGLIRPDRGRIVIGGRVLVDTENRVCLSARKRRLGYVFQDYALFPHLSVRANVGFGLRKCWSGGLSRRDRHRVDDILAAFEILPLAECLPEDLSGGQRQRVALARALVRRPAALLLDEPFCALDPALRGRMRRELLAVQRRFDLPVILVTHDAEDLAMFAETLLTFRNGAVLDCLRFAREDGQAKHEWLQAYLHRLNGEANEFKSIEDSACAVGRSGSHGFAAAAAVCR